MQCFRFSFDFSFVLNILQTLNRKLESTCCKVSLIGCKLTHINSPHNFGIGECLIIESTTQRLPMLSHRKGMYYFWTLSDLSWKAAATKYQDRPILVPAMQMVNKNNVRPLKSGEARRWHSGMSVCDSSQMINWHLLGEISPAFHFNWVIEMESLHGKEIGVSVFQEACDCNYDPHADVEIM